MFAFVWLFVHEMLLENWGLKLQHLTECSPGLYCYKISHPESLCFKTFIIVPHGSADRLSAMGQFPHRFQPGVAVRWWLEQEASHRRISQLGRTSQTAHRFPNPKPLWYHLAKRKHFSSSYCNISWRSHQVKRFLYSIDYLLFRLPTASQIFQKYGWWEHMKPLRGNKHIKPTHLNWYILKDPQHYPHQIGIL